MTGFVKPTGLFTFDLDDSNIQVKKHSSKSKMKIDEDPAMAKKKEKYIQRTIRSQFLKDLRSGSQ